MLIKLLWSGEAEAAEIFLLLLLSLLPFRVGGGGDFLRPPALPDGEMLLEGDDLTPVVVGASGELFGMLRFILALPG